MPIDGEQYLITGDDYCGDWTSKATCKYYKKGSSKSQLRVGYRWVMEDGSIEQAKHISKFELIK